MADRYWISTAGTKYWDDDANWSATDTGAGGVSFPVAGDNVYFTAASSTVTCLLRDHEACAIISIANGGILDIVTFNLVSSGVMTLTNSNSTIKIGTSADTGLTTAGITWNTGSKRDWQLLSKINCSGNWIEPNEQIGSVTTARGAVTFTASANVSKQYTNNMFNEFTINEGVSLTNTTVCQYTTSGSSKTIINGIINAQTFSMTCGSKDVFTLGANCDILGTAGAWSVFIINTSTYTNSKTGTFSYNATIYNGINSSSTNWLLTGDFRNATFAIVGGSSASGTGIFVSGTLRIKNLQVIQSANNDVIVNCATNNPSFYISDTINFKNDTATYTLTWTKGTGTITINGSSGTHNIDFQGKSIEDVIFDSVGTIKQIVSNFTTDSISGSVGTLQSSVAGTQRTITCSGTAVLTAGSIKDISMGVANKMNAKACTNLGNNAGIVFTDTLKI
uniref:Uncharacterized protein n=1 Tax=viral metagenome TaxID=1070528 RepID=A0A6M3MAA2_9ZZZZ